MVIGYTSEPYYASKSRPYIKYKYVVNGKEYKSARSIQPESIIRSSNQPILVIYDSTSASGSTAILDVDISNYNQEQLELLFKKKVELINLWNVK